MTERQGAAQNTDRELWRAIEGDYYSDSLHVTVQGGIGINSGGLIIVQTLAKWHDDAKLVAALHPQRGVILGDAIFGKTSPEFARAMAHVQRLTNLLDEFQAWLEAQIEIHQSRMNRAGEDTTDGRYWGCAVIENYNVLTELRQRRAQREPETPK